ncbi:serine/threonine protein kinase [Telmatocola sphagniphila]|uniref:Serine/threonine protein kinase n=1 Tax=Telmatocola sphagniphila TaxID=1123043 RepID=A0A8E6EX15_9BACT|nr:serine/threonine-protein kinase [Telmatocola sphagniphila]QVL34600.1 serine/threonine protein kinase [Telmatocola sphagniphila]
MVDTSHKFVEHLRESGLLEADRLDAYLKYLGDLSSLDPKVIADRMVADRLLTEFQSSQLLKGRSKGFILRGKYKILRLLGVGGMGRVFLAEHMILKRLVAIKLLSPSEAKDPSMLSRFLREARAVAAMDDPNIVRIFDVEVDVSNPLMIMEFVDGTSLQELVADGGPIPLEYAAHYIAQAALGLQHAMELGLIHRDIKPGNLLLDRNGVVKVADLGLAKFRNRGKDSTLIQQYESERVLGTADYLAPEQAIDSSAVDIRVDIYGLGGTFYFLLTGEVPFPDATIPEKVLAHQQRPVESVRRRRPEIPKEIDEIIARMMEKRPKDRYQTPQEVVDALKPWSRKPIEAPNFAWFARNPATVTIEHDPEASTDEHRMIENTAKKTAPKPSRKSPLPLGRTNRLRDVGLGVAIALLLCGLLFLLLRFVDKRNNKPAPAEQTSPGEVTAKKNEIPVGNAPADKSPKVIKLSEVKDHIDEEVTVEFKVRSANLNGLKKDTLFLCSSSDSRYSEFTVVIRRGDAEKLYQVELEELRARLEGKTIRVTGKIELYKKKPESDQKGDPQIRVTERSQLDIPAE